MEISVGNIGFTVLWYFFMQLFVFTSAFSEAHTGNDTDRFSLLEFKAKVTDPLGALNSWNESVHICEWHGITCGRRHQRVTILNINSSQLGGYLSPHIGNLSFLRKLNLSDNSFSHEIPEEIGRLFRLQSLRLENNSFSGKIPINISRCSNLQYLNLAGNNLTGEIPKEYAMGSEVSRQGDVYSYGILLLEMFTGKRPTDEMFKDRFNLHNFVKMTLPEKFVEIVDSTLLIRTDQLVERRTLAREENSNSNDIAELEVDFHVEENNSNNFENVPNSQLIMNTNLQKCLHSVLKIGISCSEDWPNERMNIGDVIVELQHIRNAYMADEISGDKRRKTN